jgi:sarcosine oxidase subunit gamma
MSDLILAERNALSGRAPIEGRNHLSVTIAENCARFSLRALAESRELASDCFGCALPPRIGGLAVSKDRVAVCLGPDEWLLLAPSADGAKIAAQFAAGLQETHSLVDVSHREVGIKVTGTAAELALAAACALDLESMPASSATRTILDKAQVVLIKHSPIRYRIEVWQSYASHVWGLLQAAAHEIALDI